MLPGFLGHDSLLFALPGRLQVVDGRTHLGKTVRADGHTGQLQEAPLRGHTQRTFVGDPFDDGHLARPDALIRDHVVAHGHIGEMPLHHLAERGLAVRGGREDGPAHQLRALRSVFHTDVVKAAHDVPGMFAAVAVQQGHPAGLGYLAAAHEQDLADGLPFLKVKYGDGCLGGGHHLHGSG